MVQNNEQSTEIVPCVPSVCFSAKHGCYTVNTQPTECVLSEDNPTQMAADDLLENQNTYIVENSNDVVIGPVTHFHCPVTIIQKSEVNGISVPRELIEKTGDENNTHKNLDWDKNITDTDHTTSSNQPSLQKKLDQKFVLLFNYFKVRRKVLRIILFASTLMVVITIVTGSIYATNIIKKSPRDSIGNSTYRDPIPVTNVSEPYDPTSDEPQIIPRYVWGARPPLSSRPLKTPVKYVIVAHTGSASCGTLEKCSGIMQSLQSYAVDHASPDIGYNFLVGGDGDIYMGRGWDAINYLENYCISVAFIGNFSFDDFTTKMQEALKKILRLGVENSKLVENYILLSHSQTGATISPGLKIRSVIEKWPHYYTKDYIEIHE